MHYGDALDLRIKAGDPANAPVWLEGIASAVATRDPERAARRSAVVGSRHVGPILAGACADGIEVRA